MWNKETNRPENWDESAVLLYSSWEMEYPSRRQAYEAGADAIVEPAKAEGRRELMERLEKEYPPITTWQCWQQLLKELPSK